MSNKRLLDKLEEFLKTSQFGDVEGAVLCWIAEQRRDLPATREVVGYVERDVNYNYKFFTDPAGQRFDVPKVLMGCQEKLVDNPAKVRVTIETIK